MQFKKSDIIRLLYYFTPGKMSECWNWTGTKNASGHPVIKMGGKLYYVRRIQALLYKLPIEGKVVQQHCKNKACCNPMHLYVKDADHKLTEKEVKEILKSDLGPYKLARIYNVGYETIRKKRYAAKQSTERSSD